MNVVKASTCIFKSGLSDMFLDSIGVWMDVVVVVCIIVCIVTPMSIKIPIYHFVSIVWILKTIKIANDYIWSEET